MLEWLAANWLPLLIVIIVVAIALTYFIKRKGLRQVAIDAIVWAERMYGSEEGKEKMQKAIDYMQQIVPFLNFIPDSIIHSFIQGVFNQIKEALDQQPAEKKTVEIIDESAG